MHDQTERLVEEEGGASQCSTDGGASSVAASAPEHPIDIVQGGKTQTSIKERIAARHSRNRQVKRALLQEAKKATEEEPEKPPLPRVRYQLQKFTNGEGDKPTEYEAWRREINDKKRTARLEQERDDLSRPGRSPNVAHIDRRAMLDGQIDDFLSEYIEEHGEYE
jgi:hypothetical protein